MKIAILTDHFNPDSGYMEFYLARELSRLGNQVAVICTNTVHSSSSSTSEFSVYEISQTLRVNDYAVPGLRGLYELITMLSKFRPQIIHCQPLFSPLALLIMLLKPFYGYRIVGSIITGSLSTKSISLRIKHFISRLAVKFLAIRTTSLFFAISNPIRKYLLINYRIPMKNTRVVHLGADSELFHRDVKSGISIRKKLSIPLDSVILVYSGRISPSKGIHLILEALRRIKNIVNDTYLLVIGKGPNDYRLRLDKLAKKLGIDQNIIFQEQVHRSQLANYYSASDIAIWPAAPSVSIIEAAAVGLPVVIERSPFTDYLTANNNGFAFNRGNVSELVTCLEKLILDEQLRKQMGHQSRQLVDSLLDWSIIAKQYFELYEEAIRSSDSKTSVITE